MTEQEIAKLEEQAELIVTFGIRRKVLDDLLAAARSEARMRTALMQIHNTCLLEWVQKIAREALAQADEGG